MFYAGPCDGGVYALHGSRGQISSKGTYYKDQEMCRWRIEVDTSKVRMSSTVIQ